MVMFQHSQIRPDRMYCEPNCKSKNRMFNMLKSAGLCDIDSKSLVWLENKRIGHFHRKFWYTEYLITRKFRLFDSVNSTKKEWKRESYSMMKWTISVVQHLKTTGMFRWFLMNFEKNWRDSEFFSENLGNFHFLPVVDFEF